MMSTVHIKHIMQNHKQSINYMNWFYNICSCITPQFRLNIIDYLNSNQLNRQVVEEEKCYESQEPDVDEPTHHVYAMAKSRSVNFMKLEEKSDDEEQQRSPDKQDQVIDAFWYSKLKKGQNKWENYRHLLTHKSRVLSIILEQEPANKGYDKIYESQDQINLKVYCKLESLVRGKKVNSYRFSFEIAGLKITQYEKWSKQVQQKTIFPLLETQEKLESDPQYPEFSVSRKCYKKLLVVSPHEFMIAKKTFGVDPEQKSILAVAFSLEDQAKEDTNYQKGWLHLCGMEVVETQVGLHFNGYFCVQLNVSVSPNMLKQPFAKEIRIFVQKLICSIKKSDEI